MGSLKYFRFFLLALIAPISGLAQSTPTSAPVSIPYCELAMNPQLYDGKEIKLRGKVNLEFENFTVYDPQCYRSPQTWLMFGGDVPTPIMSLWGDMKRPPGANIKFKGVEYSLEKDQAFDDFYYHITARENRKAVYRVTATLVGTFFAGNPKQDKRLKAVMPGYGHFGCCYLFIMSRVSEVESKPFTDDWNEMRTKRLEEMGKRIKR